MAKLCWPMGAGQFIMRLSFSFTHTHTHTRKLMNVQQQGKFLRCARVKKKKKKKRVEKRQACRGGATLKFTSFLSLDLGRESRCFPLSWRPASCVLFWFFDLVARPKTTTTPASATLSLLAAINHSRPRPRRTFSLGALVRSHASTSIRAHNNLSAGHLLVCC